MEVRTEGSFRTRERDGSLELWMQGWRLDVRVAPLVPLVLAVGFAISSIGLPVKIVGCAALLGTGYFLVRLTKLGVQLRPEGVQVVNVVRTVRVDWKDFAAFVGERSQHDGRLAVLRADGQRIVTAGALTGEEMNPIGEEGDLSAVDELNRLAERYRRGLPAAEPRVAAPTPAAEATSAPTRTRTRVKSPARRASERREDERRATERRIALETDAARLAAELEAQRAELEELTQKHVELTGAAWHGPVDPGPVAPTNTGVRHPYVPRPPAAPDPEPEPAGRRRGRRRRKTVQVPQGVVQLPEPEPMSPGARMLQELERRGGA